MATNKIQATKDYALFQRSADNRPTNLGKHKKLLKSVEKYGFLRSFPIVCRRDDKGNLIVKDGQHRLMIAASLGLTVYWVEEEVDFDIAVINCASRGWVLRDYADKFAKNGVKSYRDGLEFAETHGLPLGMAFAMLMGTTTFSNCQDSFVDGTFKIKDRPWADAVAEIYVPLTLIAPAIKCANFLLACMAVCRVPVFDAKRLLEAAPKCRSKLVAYSHRDDYLTALEEIYNFKRTHNNLLALKMEAIKTMRERSSAGAPKKDSAASKTPRAKKTA